MVEAWGTHETDVKKRSEDARKVMPLWRNKQHSPESIVEQSLTHIWVVAARSSSQLSTPGSGMDYWKRCRSLTRLDIVKNEEDDCDGGCDWKHWKWTAKWFSHCMRMSEERGPRGALVGRGHPRTKWKEGDMGDMTGKDLDGPPLLNRPIKVKSSQVLLLNKTMTLWTWSAKRRWNVSLKKKS